MKKKLFLNKEIFGWAMFDFANSSYTTVIITAIFNVYFVNTIVGDESNSGDFLWAIALSLSYFLVALLAPIIGAIADYSSQRKRFLFYSYLVCVIFTFLLIFTGKGTLTLAIIFLVLSNAGFAFSENLVSSFLPEIATKENMGRISGYGWGLGYFGGIFSLVGSLFLLNVFKDTWFEVRSTFAFTAIFFAVSAIPTFIWLRERTLAKPKVKGLLNYAKIGYQRLGKTFAHIRQFQELIKLLFAFFLYYAGLATVISYAAIYAKKTFRFSDESIILLLIISNSTAALGAILFGFIQDRIGAKKTLVSTLILWILVITGIYFTNSKSAFWVLTSMAGLGIGSTQSATRAMVGLFSPKTKSAEFFGFWGFFGKLSAILGIGAFGLLSLITDSQKLAMLSTITLFVLGFLLLMPVNEAKGIKNALDYEKSQE